MAVGVRTTLTCLFRFYLGVKNRVVPLDNFMIYKDIIRDCLGTLFRNSLTVGSLKKINNLFIKDIFHGYCLKRQSLIVFSCTKTKTRAQPPWDRGRFARIGSAVASGTLLAFSILRACPKPAGCRRSQRTGLPARRLPSRRDRLVKESARSRPRNPYANPLARLGGPGFRICRRNSGGRRGSG